MTGTERLTSFRASGRRGQYPRRGPESPASATDKLNRLKGFSDCHAYAIRNGSKTSPNRRPLPGVMVVALPLFWYYPWHESDH
jgi:hypothetical protein